MTGKRVKRLNSLLKEVISEVVRGDIRNPSLSKLLTITEVDISADLSCAKVLVSVIGEEQEKSETIKILNSAAGYISVTASKKVTMRKFPTLSFKLDDSVDKQFRINSLISKIHEEEANRE